jgi:heme exporter protein CcmD
MNHFYIWGSYGVTFALLALEVILVIRRMRKCETKA